MNLVPGGPFVAEKSISKAAQQALAEKYGLDKALGVQYLNYMNSLIHGDMGLSLKQRGRTVNQIIFSKLPVSARTAGLAVLVALCVGIPLGCLSAYNRGKWADNLIIVCHLRHRHPELYLKRCAFGHLRHEPEAPAHRRPE